MLTCIIIEEQLHHQKTLKAMLIQHCPQIQILAQCNNIENGQTVLTQYRPDLVFIGTILGKQTGFEFLAAFGLHDFDVIFTTSDDKHALKAFRANAIDCLMHPITVSDLKEAVNKAEKNRHLPVSLPPELIKVLENFKENKDKKPLLKIAISSTAEIEFVSIDDIIYIEGVKNYSTFTLYDKRKITVAKTLGEYEKMLENTNLIRIHKSHIVNINYVKKYLKNGGGWIQTIDGFEIPVSSTKRDLLLEMLGCNHA
jgi:two-component system, LytTR family, response regulator